MKTPTKRALADRSDRPDELVAAGRQVEMIFRPGQRALSLRAGKMWHLLVKAAGVDLAANKAHSMPLADLYQSGIGHMTQAERIEALRELQTTLVEVRIPSPKVAGRMRIVSESLLARVERDEDDRGELVWKFGETLRTVFANSDHWAVLSKRAVMTFESRYSLRLYEIVALRAGLDHKTTETFDLEDLRSRLGVPPGKLLTWPHIRQRALDPAIAEVNQLAGFTVGYEPIKRGRAVSAVKLSWATKAAPERKATKRELDAPKVGRSARRAGTVEAVSAPPPTVTAPKAPAFPASGSILRDTFWDPLARENAKRLPGGHVPDLGGLSDAFRQWSAAKGLPLMGPDVAKRFVGFCKSYRPLFSAED
jgi:hypothetical protein